MRTREEAREAARIRAREWYWANRDRARESSRKYREKNRAHLIARSAEHRKENLERLRAYDRERAGTTERKEQHRVWRTKPENSVKCVERARRWAAANPERVATLREKSNARRRARELDAFVEDVDRQELIDSSDGLCGLCGRTLTEPIEIDHIYPLSMGGLHSFINTHATHRVCNRRKGASMPDIIYSL